MRAIGFIVVIILILIVARALSGPESLAVSPVSSWVITRVLEQTRNSRGIDLYEYRGRQVLLVTVGCCDHMAMAYTLQGTKIGSPFGGISGKGDGTMPDWFPNAQFIQHIYGRS